MEKKVNKPDSKKYAEELAKALKKSSDKTAINKTFSTSTC